jgi:hypothetical protein
LETKTHKRKKPQKADAREVSKKPKAKLAIRKKRSKAKLGPPRTEAEYSAKPERFKDTWDRVLGVVSKMRREKVSPTQASHDAGISPRTVTRWGKTALQKQKNGKYVVKKSDSLLRLVMIPTPDGTRDIAIVVQSGSLCLPSIGTLSITICKLATHLRSRSFRASTSEMQMALIFRCRLISAL